MSVDIFRALRARGWSGIGAAYKMGWFGEGVPPKVHRDGVYVANDPAIIAKQLELMQFVGISAVIQMWMGAVVNPFLHQTALRTLAECERRNMKFALLLDPWIAKKSSTQKLDPTEAVLSQLKTADFAHMMASPAYLAGRFLLEFDLAASAGVNLAAMRSAATALGVTVLSKHTGYSWVEPTNTIATLARDNAAPGMKVPGLCLGFNDAGWPRLDGTRDYAQSVWGGGPARVIDHRAGNYFLDQVAVTPTDKGVVGLITWDDYDEGTGVEYLAAILKGLRL